MPNYLESSFKKDTVMIKCELELCTLKPMVNKDKGISDFLQYFEFFCKFSYHLTGVKD